MLLLTGTILFDLFVQSRGQILADRMSSVHTSTSRDIAKNELTRAKASSGLINRFDAIEWGYFLLKSSTDAEGRGHGLVHEVIKDTELRVGIEERLEIVLDECEDIHRVDTMSFDKLRRMINDFLHCVESLRHYFLFLAHSISAATTTGKHQVC